MLRRTLPSLSASRRRIGPLALELRAHDARYAGERIELSRMEWELLVKLASEPASTVAFGAER